MLLVYAQEHFFVPKAYNVKNAGGVFLKNLRSHIQGKNETEQSAAELTKKIAAAYDGKSGKGIWLQILSEAEKSKKEGRLTAEEIDEFYAQFSPMLDDAQRKQLKSVVERLKEI